MTLEDVHAITRVTGSQTMLYPTVYPRIHPSFVRQSMYCIESIQYMLNTIDVGKRMQTNVRIIESTKA